MFVSYAQNFEDVMLWRALRQVARGVYVDVGAAWPEQHSVTKAFYERGWSGINIEPNPDFYRALVQQRERDVNLDLALGDRAGHVTMRFIPDTGLSSIDERIVQEHEQAGWNVDPQQVSMQTLSAVLAEHLPEGEDIHFLKIDVEGLEEAVLRGNDWVRFRPWVVVIEATMPMSRTESHQKWEPLLLTADYVFAYADGLNRFYVAKEKSALLEAFSYPPNVFDDFVSSTQVNIQSELEQARKEVECLRAQLGSTRLDVDALSVQVSGLESRTKTLMQERDDVLRQLQAVHQSNSWRFTYPLRAASPKRLVREVGRFVLCHEAFAEPLKTWLANYPSLQRWLRKVVLGADAELSLPGTDTPTFTRISLPQFDLLFSDGPLKDRRGIGRVARAQLAELQRLATETVLFENADNPAATVHFYTSIHWCPDVLPVHSVVMIHDVIPLLFPEQFPRSVIAAWQYRYKRIAQQADHIVTISASSKKEITRLLQVPDDKVSVIHNGVTPLPLASSTSAQLPDQPYVVYLGAYDHHKNLDVVLQALTTPEANDVHLVMIGDNQSCESEVKRLGLSERTHFLGKLPDDEVGHVIQRAKALVFPSLYEGFGLPPLEAALIGTPAICSDRPAMNELIDAGAIFCDPLRADEWSVAISKMAHQGFPENEMKRMQNKIRTEYTWGASVEELLRILRQIYLRDSVAQ